MIYLHKNGVTIVARYDTCQLKNRQAKQGANKR